jgi:hypothetical protein
MTSCNVTLQHGVRHDIEVCLIDIDGLPGFHRLSGPQNCGKGGWFGQRPHIESRLSLPGATGPAPACQRRLSGRLRSWLEWITFVVGLAMTGLFGGFLLIVTGYTRRMEGRCSSAPPSWPMPTSSCKPSWMPPARPKPMSAIWPCTTA